MQSNCALPLSPENHLTPSLSPTPWRRGRRKTRSAMIPVFNAEHRCRCQWFFSGISNHSSWPLINIGRRGNAALPIELNQLQRLEFPAEDGFAAGFEPGFED